MCVAESVGDERRATAQLLAVLGEFDVRRLYLGQGFSSLFAYCVGCLHLSERAAYSRIEAARLARRFPIIIELVADSRVSLTAVALLARHLNKANYQVLLSEATHKTVREIEVIVARLAPRPDVPSLVRRVSQPAIATAATSPADLSPSHSAPMLDAQMLAPPLSTAPPPQAPAAPRPEHFRAVLTPTSPERYKLQVTLSRAAHDKLRCAQNLLRHSVPGGDLGCVLERALDALLDDIERRKLAIVLRPREQKPRGEPRSPSSRHIPAAVRRAVWNRDGGRCAFVGVAGRCTARALLELHHVRPFAAGGDATTENIELRCRAHNAHEAELSFKPKV